MDLPLKAYFPNKGKQAVKCSKVVTNALALIFDALLLLYSSLFLPESCQSIIILARSFGQKACSDDLHWVTCQ